MQFQGRLYDISKPDTPATVPLLIALHGGGGSGLEFAKQLKLGTLFKQRAIYAFPTATFNNGNPPARTWNSNDTLSSFNNAPDSEYLKDLALYLKSTSESEGFIISEIILIGYSNGAMMCYRLVIDHPEIFSGVFVLSGDVMVNNPNTYTGRIKHLHGQNDMNIPLSGGVGIGSVSYPPVIQTVQQFTNVNDNSGIMAGNLLTDDLIVLPAEHSIASIKEALVAQSTTLQQLIYNFVFP